MAKEMGTWPINYKKHSWYSSFDITFWLWCTPFTKIQKHCFRLACSSTLTSQDMVYLTNQNSVHQSGPITWSITVV